MSLHWHLNIKQKKLTADIERRAYKVSKSIQNDYVLTLNNLCIPKLQKTLDGHVNIYRDLQMIREDVNIKHDHKSSHEIFYIWTRTRGHLSLAWMTHHSTLSDGWVVQVLIPFNPSTGLFWPFTTRWGVVVVTIIIKENSQAGNQSTYW